MLIYKIRNTDFLTGRRWMVMYFNPLIYTGWTSGSLTLNNRLKTPNQVLVHWDCNTTVPPFHILWKKKNSIIDIEHRNTPVLSYVLRSRWYYFFLIYFATVFLSTLDTMQLHLRFGRLPFWLSRVDKRLPNTTVVHIYFLSYDFFFPQKSCVLLLSKPSINSRKKKHDFFYGLPMSL